MRIATTAFQACDIRGVYGDAPDAVVSPALAQLVGRGLAARTPSSAQIVIGGDGRSSTPALLRGLKQGFARPCTDLGAGVPTPLVYVARELLGAHTSAIVTASHNPARFNGFKIQLGDTPITPQLLREIRADVLTWASDVAPETTQPEHDADARRETWRAYREDIARRFERVSGRRLVVDCMHGSYSRYAPQALQGMGYAVVALHDQCDGAFMGLDPDPSIDRNLDVIAQSVRAAGAVFGAALDGDGDRVRFVDEHGSPVNNGTVLVLLARFLARRGLGDCAPTVVYDQKMPLAVVRALEEAGLSPARERSGHTFMRTRVLTEDAVLGGEASGHVFWGRGEHMVPAGDCGLFAIFAMDAMLRLSGVTLSELCAEVPASPYYSGDVRGLHCTGDREAWMDAVATHARSRGFHLDRVDGVRIETDRAFAHVRSSVTESDMLTATLDGLDGPSLRDIADALLAAMPAESDAIIAPIRKRVDVLLAQ